MFHFSAVGASLTPGWVRRSKAFLQQSHPPVSRKRTVKNLRDLTMETQKIVFTFIF